MFKFWKRKKETKNEEESAPAMKEEASGGAEKAK